MQIATRNEVDNLSNELKLAVRAYGRQAGDLLLRPSQVRMVRYIWYISSLIKSNQNLC